MYAAVSAYWGLGGTGLLDSIGGTLEREGRAGNAGLLAVLWVTVVLKLLAAILGMWPSSGIGGYARGTARWRAERPGPPR